MGKKSPLSGGVASFPRITGTCCQAMCLRGRENICGTDSDHCTNGAESFSIVQHNARCEILHCGVQNSPSTSCLPECKYCWGVSQPSRSLSRRFSLHCNEGLITQYDKISAFVHQKKIQLSHCCLRHINHN